MSGLRRSVVSAWRAVSLLGTAGAVNVSQHWMLAIFSLAAAFGVWMVIQDVENPRVEGLAPVETDSRIPVQAVNVPDGYIVLDLQQVKAQVKARKDELGELRPGDFRATV